MKGKSAKVNGFRMKQDLMKIKKGKEVSAFKKNI
jgi:hypothetical protein